MRRNDCYKVKIDESGSHRFKEEYCTMYFDDCWILPGNLTRITDVGDLLLYSELEMCFTPQNEGGFKVWTGDAGMTLVSSKDGSINSQYFMSVQEALENTASMSSSNQPPTSPEMFTELESLNSVSGLYNQVIDGCNADAYYIRNMTPSGSQFFLDEHNVLWFAISVTREEFVQETVEEYLDRKREQEELMQEAWARDGLKKHKSCMLTNKKEVANRQTYGKQRRGYTKEGKKNYFY